MKNPQRFVLLLIAILLSSIGHAQISYLSKYKSGMYVEGFGTGPFFSVGGERTFNRGIKTYNTFRLGVGIVVDGSFDLKNLDYTFPVSLTRSFIINNLKKRVKHRVSLRCNAQPPKFATEWFFETGVGYTPSIYSLTDQRHRFYGILAFKQQFVINKPPKPKVFYIKVQYNPYYYHTKFYLPRSERIVLLPSTTGIVTGISVGTNFK